MAKEHEIYWYLESPEVAKTFLYHCRDRDLRPGSGIERGAIIQGEKAADLSHICHVTTAIRGKCSRACSGGIANAIRLLKTSENAELFDQDLITK